MPGESRSRALTPDAAAAVPESFRLGRRELLGGIARAGRAPELPHGGCLRTAEAAVPAYPKLYDMKAPDPATVVRLQHQFGRLHVDHAKSGAGMDEVMTIVCGGPHTCFFTLPGDVVGKLRLRRVGPGDPAWRLSDPGLVPHGGYFDAADGIVLAHAHGPRGS